MTLVVGITGGIGAGKSTLSEYLKKKRFPVHESDKIVSDMYNKPNKSFLNIVIKNGLKGAVKKRKIDKKFITNVFFVNQKIKNILQKYIHKELKASRERFIKKNINTKKKAIFLDIPLLLENKLEKNFDYVVCVISTKKIRTIRVLKDKKFKKKILNKIFKSQTTNKERRSRSNIIINNNKTKKDFIFAAEQALMRIIKWEKL